MTWIMVFHIAVGGLFDGWPTWVTYYGDQVYNSYPVCMEAVKNGNASTGQAIGYITCESTADIGRR